MKTPFHPTPVGGQSPVSWKQWGHDLDPASIEQMRAACSLPVSVAGALMPDAHTGYGLPIEECSRQLALSSPTRWEWTLPAA
ncbi:MAG: hypothetical protein PHF70_07145 [Opitutales bacterium]|nr:hypothetical protein [Opitutales bacterium]